MSTLALEVGKLSKMKVFMFIRNLSFHFTGYKISYFPVTLHRSVGFVALTCGDKMEGWRDTSVTTDPVSNTLPSSPSL